MNDLKFETNERMSAFSERFLKKRTVKNKKQIYISVETFEMIRSYLKYIGDASFIAYVDNIGASVKAV
jgi:hypothetical protein